MKPRDPVMDYAVATIRVLDACENVARSTRDLGRAMAQYGRAYVEANRAGKQEMQRAWKATKGLGLRGFWREWNLGIGLMNHTDKP
jgi:hypothetical protein